MSKAYSYLRFSTPEQSRGDSFRRQSTLASEYARRHGLTLDSELTFQDLGVSAFRGKNAETGRLADFLVAVEDGLVPRDSYLLVESLDRISRQAARKALRVLESIVESGITVVTLNDGRSYTLDGLDNDPMALMLALLTFIRANEESATKSRRLSAVWSAKRANAGTKALTAVCPAWLRLDTASGRFQAVPERAAIVERIFAEAVAGRGQHAIAQGLNRDQVPMFGHRGRVGKQWHRSYVVKILANPAVIGTSTPHRLEHVSGTKRRVAMDPIPGYYPAVVTQDVFDRVHTMRDGTRQPLRGRHAGTEVRNILGGLARCPVCEGTMTLTSKGPNWRYLVCSKAKAGAGCDYQTVRYQDVEEGMLLYAEEITSEAPRESAELNRLREEAIKVEGFVDHLNEQLETLLDAASHRSSPALATLIAETEAKRTTARNELANFESRCGALTPSRWQSRLDEFKTTAQAESIDRLAMNALLRSLLSAVVVDYRVRMLRFRWKHGGESFVHYVTPSSVANLPRRQLGRLHVSS